MKFIKLTNSKLITLVDDCDCEWLSKFKWRLNISSTGREFVTAWIGKRTTHIHRLIMNAPPNLEVDHWNRDTLDNRRGNLRICSHSQNLANRPKFSNKILPKGVHSRGLKFEAMIVVKRKRVRLGTFKTTKEAADAYDSAAIKYYGEFACLNNIGPPDGKESQCCGV